MKKIILLIILLCLPTVLADICEDRLDNGSDCLMITPSIICANYTYDIFYSNGTNIVNNADLIQLNNTIYYFNFTNQTGDYIVRLCDDTTREFRVTETYDEKFNNEVGGRMYIAAMIGLIACLAFFVYLYYHFKKGEYGEWVSLVRFIFITMAYYTMMGIMRFGIEMLRDNNKTGLANVFNSFWIILMYSYGFLFFIIMFLFGVRFLWAVVEKRKYRGL